MAHGGNRDAQPGDGERARGTIAYTESVAYTHSGEGDASSDDAQSLWRAATVAAGEGADDPIDDAAARDSDGAALAGALADSVRRYRSREVLGAGGMGEVRLCRDQAIGREVAVKTILPEQRRRKSERRFLREVRIQGQLEHPSIVPVYDMGVGADGELFFTMRRVRGRTLADVLRALAAGDREMRERYTRHKLLAAFVSVCLTVDYAHARGVVHRDLKPANVMLGDFGEVYVLDWGIARLRGADDAAAATAAAPAAAPVELGTDDAAPAAVAGTPGYMAPEQLRGDAEQQDARTDVFALGAMLFELLALRPLHAGTPAERARATLDGADARPSRAAADVPPELDLACVRATAAAPVDRFASARELARTIERFLEGDRDLARRRELAAERVADGARALERAHQAGVGGEDAEAARAEATRQVMQALALDVDQPEARRLLVELLLEVPEKLPPSVEAEREQASHRARLQFARFGIFALVGWAATIPLVALLGVREWIAFALAAALCIASAGVALRLWLRRSTTRREFLVLWVLVAATCGALSCWLGPFVLVPTAAATSIIWFTFQADRRERWLLSAIGGVAMLAPFLLELLGWVPRSYSFDGDTLVLHARALHLPPVGTTIALVYSSVSFCVLQPLLLGGIRDALTTAENKLFLQSWQLRQLAPERPLDRRRAT